jgi:hypothetical protein
MHGLQPAAAAVQQAAVRLQPISNLSRGSGRKELQLQLLSVVCCPVVVVIGGCVELQRPGPGGYIRRARTAGAGGPRRRQPPKPKSRPASVRVPMELLVGLLPCLGCLMELALRVISSQPPFCAFPAGKRVVVVEEWRWRRWRSTKNVSPSRTRWCNRTPPPPPPLALAIGA